MAEWIKFDKWKSNVELIPWEVLLKVWIILWFWKEKYWKNSWQNLDNFEDRYLWAALRHIYQHQSWEIFDSESWQTHLWHALTNLIFLVYKQIQDEKDWKLWNELFKNSWEDSK